MARRRWLAGMAALGSLALVGCGTLVPDSFTTGPTKGPFAADGICPQFATSYPRCEVRFGNRGLSTLNSLYETFVGQGAFEIAAFSVETLGQGRFNITAQSNRGPLLSQIHADRVVRLGQDLENEVVYRTHQSAFCDAGRIYEHQVGYVDGSLNVQELEFWTARDALHFRLFQNGSATAEVVCEPETLGAAER